MNGKFLADVNLLERLAGSCGQEKDAAGVSRAGAILRAMSHKSPDSSRPPVKVVRSARRRKTVTAYRQGETVVVLLPARMSRREEDHWVATMLERLERRARQVVPGDAELERRARLLARRYLEDGRAALGPLGGEHAGTGTAPAPPTTAPSGCRTASPRGRPGSATTCSSTSWPTWPCARPLAGVLAAGRPLSAFGAARGFLIAKGMEDDED